MFTEKEKDLLCYMIDEKIEENEGLIEDCTIKKDIQSINNEITMLINLKNKIGGIK